MIQHWKKWGILFISIGVSGCNSIPESIKVSSPAVQQSFVAMHAAPQKFIGQEVRLGGRVLTVDNQSDITRLEITNMPLDNGARPVIDSPSLGRFFADVDHFLEPVDYQGYFVTVVGKVTGVETGKIGKVPYKFVTIKVNGLQRWNIIRQIYPIGPPVWAGPPENRIYINTPVQVESMLSE